MAQATCPPPHLDDNFEPIAFPQDPNYDPATYASELYNRFADAFDAPNKRVVVGQLTPRWDRSKPLPHEVHFTPESAYESRGQLFHDLIYAYPLAYDFEGAEVTASGYLPLDTVRMGLRMRLGEGYAPRPLFSDEPGLFVVTDDGARMYVQGVECHETTWEVPTAEALEILGACIVNNGCAD